MSDDDNPENAGRDISEEFVAVERELRNESFFDSIKEQLSGMVGMAFMFVITIAIALFIRPWYDVAGLHAFGEAGATQVKYIALELAFIFIFTAAILVLAKYKKDWIIKYGIMGILAIALMYTTVPLAHMIVIDFDPEPFEYDAASTNTSEYYLTQYGMDGFLTTELTGEADGPWNDSVSYWQGQPFEGEPVWQGDQQRSPGNDVGGTRVILNGNIATFTNGVWIWTVDIDTGEKLNTYACHAYSDDLEPQLIALPNMHTGCSLAVLIDDSMYMIANDDSIFHYRVFENNVLTYQAKWAMPTGLEVSNGVLYSEAISEDRLLITTATQVCVIELEETNTELLPNLETQPATTVFTSNATESYVSSDFGHSPWSDVTMENASADTGFILLGENNGSVIGFEWNQSAEVEVEEQTNMHMMDFSDTIQSVRLTDLDVSGYTDMLIATDDTAHWLHGTLLKNRISFPVDTNFIAGYFIDESENSSQFVALYDNDGTTAKHGQVTGEMMSLDGLQLYDGPFLAGLIIAIALMVLLYVHSEWYVVNTVGILVGAGVIVMLGVAFVPSLIIIFMIVAAAYDAWAVYKSKHMLELADTMIGLRLPILLVAPQDKGYSFKDNQAQISDKGGDIPAQTSSNTKPAKTAAKNNGGEAMFMGLGDVIFPGMLVLSCAQWLDESVAMPVAMGALVGGLCGYVALMYFVAQGKAQAGLPLLNGGAILGYIITGLLFIGTSLFSFGISW
ncbi:MAG: presenilin family intramembrane aspartyl protease [Candidatus Poseidoniaceae archaeon]|nr:presenilin family intramembrane aspartyl protease [Candidatus Poseidoniaceae archaeon]